MDGRGIGEGLTPEQLAEAKRVYEVIKQASDEEHWRIACLMASKQDHELFGQTEFQVRQHVLRIGAKAMEVAVDQRRKKGGTKAAAPFAAGVSKTHGSSAGGRKPS